MENGRNSTKVYVRIWIKTDQLPREDWHHYSLCQRAASVLVSRVRHWLWRRERHRPSPTIPTNEQIGNN